MEGSLRSAAYVLHRILDKKGTSLKKKEDGSFAFMREAGLQVEEEYFGRLQEWADHLDSPELGMDYLYQPGTANAGSAPVEKGPEIQQKSRNG
jgi:hypothetical protein